MANGFLDMLKNSAKSVGNAVGDFFELGKSSNNKSSGLLDMFDFNGDKKFTIGDVGSGMGKLGNFLSSDGTKNLLDGLLAYKQYDLAKKQFKANNARSQGLYNIQMRRAQEEEEKQKRQDAAFQKAWLESSRT